MRLLEPRFFVTLSAIVVATFAVANDSAFSQGRIDPSTTPVVNLSDADQGIDLRPFLRIFRDDDKAFDFEAAKARFDSGADIETFSSIERFDGPRSTYWVHFRLQSDLERQAHRFIYIPYERLISTEFYSVSGDRFLGSFTGGLMGPVNEGAITDRVPNTQVIFRPGTLIDVYLRVEDLQYLHLPMKLQSNVAFYRENHANILVLGATLGLIVAAFFYLAIMSRLTRDWSVPVLMAYLFFNGGFIALTSGLSRDVIGDLGARNTLVVLDILILGLWGSGLAFGRILLGTDLAFPRYDKALAVLVGLCLVLMPVSIIWPGITNAVLLGLPLILVVAVIGLIALVLKVQLSGARDWVLGAGLTSLGVIVHNLIGLGLIPLNGFTGNALFFSLALSGVIFSSAVAERIRAAQRERDARQREIVNSALDGIVTADAGGNIVEFNPAAEKMFNCRRKDVIGMPWTDLILAPRMRESILAHDGSTDPAQLIRVLPQERTRSISRRISGEEFPIEFTVTQTKVGDVEYYTGHIRDLTQVKKIETELERQREVLFQSEKLSALGSLLAGVAHELNNPLSIIVGRSSMLKEAAGDEKVRKSASKIHDAANRCARIVRTFLAMARQRPQRAENTDLNEIVDTALELLAYNLRDDNIDVQLDLAPDLPETRADPDQLTQVIINLIVNAQHALNQLDQERKIHISTRYHRNSDHFDIVVEDNGPGIPGDVRSRIFDPFFTTKPVGSGTGLGLSVSQGMVQSHGGSLEYHQASSGGAVFEVKLPRRRGLAAVAADDAQEVQASQKAAILVVDDDEEACATLQDLLRSRGYRLAMETKAENALQRLESEGFDIIISDIRMPGMDGVGFFDVLEKKRPLDVERLIFITGDAVNQRAQDLKLRSGRPIVDKPIDIDELTATIQVVLNNLAPAAQEIPLAVEA